MVESATIRNSPEPYFGSSEIPCILLLGGNGARLYPLTAVINKHLLPAYDKPVSLYAFDFLQESGIRKIIAVTSPKDMDLFAELLEYNKRAGTDVLYVVQDKPLGTAQAIKLAERLVTEDNFFTMCGDNVFEYNLKNSVEQRLEGKCRLHLARVDNPHEFGVVEIDNKGGVISIEDKPTFPRSSIVCTGFMGFSSEVFGLIEKIKPNVKGELDIMDVVRIAQAEKMLEYFFVKGGWIDAGVSFETLLAAAILAKEKGLNKTYGQT